jgi:cholesterol transport system auxiliary component
MGCSLGGANRVAPKLYDFGGAVAVEQPLPAVALGSVTASPTLSGTEIRYRYESDPYQARAYGESRWLAPPAQLLENRLAAALAGPATEKSHDTFGPPTTAPLRLSVELQVFEHLLGSGGGSRALLRMVAEVQDARTRQTIGRRLLAGERATPSTDATGAVTALVELAHAAVAELIEWLADEVERLPEPSEPAEPVDPDQRGDDPPSRRARP